MQKDVRSTKNGREDREYLGWIMRFQNCRGGSSLSAQTEEMHIKEQSLLLYLEVSCPQHLKQQHVLLLYEFPRVLHHSTRTLMGSGTCLAVLL